MTGKLCALPGKKADDSEKNGMPANGYRLFESHVHPCERRLFDFVKSVKICAFSVFICVLIARVS
jgi:hypothetical protein